MIAHMTQALSRYFNQWSAVHDVGSSKIDVDSWSFTLAQIEGRSGKRGTHSDDSATVSGSATVNRREARPVIDDVCNPEPDEEALASPQPAHNTLAVA